MDKHSKEYEGQTITNQPNCTLKDTGHYHCDINGCWHKVEVVAGLCDDRFDIGAQFYMIGNYPQVEIEQYVS